MIVAPGNIKELADGIRRLRSEESLRNSLRTKGLARVIDYTWASTARSTINVFEEVVEAGQ
jgi:glycosyltransferase involved in cell wall biosynthesis